MEYKLTRELFYNNIPEIFFRDFPQTKNMYFQTDIMIFFDLKRIS